MDAQILNPIINDIYTKGNRKIRETFTPDGILKRTFGTHNHRTGEYNYNYLETDKGDLVTKAAEIYEVYEALEVYRSTPTSENLVNLLYEVGDVIFQRQVIEMFKSEREKQICLLFLILL